MKQLFMSQKPFTKWRQHFFSNIINHFLPKTQNFVLFLPYDIVQISPAGDPNTYQIVMVT